MFVKATGRSLYQEVVNQISEMILSGAVAKGELLPSESTLCDQLGVSRTTVREALHILQERNIIKTMKGKGSVVISDDFAYIDEGTRSSLLRFQNTLEHAVEARLLFEPVIARLACQTATKQDIEDMQKAIAVCDHDTEKNVTSKELRRFHFLVARSTHNPVLESVVELLITMCDAPPDTNIVAPNPGLRLKPGINVSHKMILDAIIDKRGEDAFFYMKENVKEFYNNTIAEISHKSSEQQQE